MRMRRLRLLSLLLGVTSLALTPAVAAAQHARLVPYHTLLAPGADARATDHSLGSGIRTASAAPQGIRAQTPYVPYFFQNKVRYDKFEWHIYKTDHFEIYF